MDTSKPNPKSTEAIVRTLEQRLDALEKQIVEVKLLQSLRWHREKWQKRRELFESLGHPELADLRNTNKTTNETK